MLEVYIRELPALMSSLLVEKPVKFAGPPVISYIAFDYCFYFLHN